MKAPDWLAHLRTDERGRPVPYVNRWGDEDADRLSLRYDPHVNGTAVFLDDSRELVPDFTAQSMQRQRECIFTGRCQVCGRRIESGVLWLPVSTMSVRSVVIEGHGERVVVTEPWLDERCADFATSTCPALIRRAAVDDLRLFPVRSQREVMASCSRGWIEGPLEAESRLVMPYMWGEIVPLAISITMGS